MESILRELSTSRREDAPFPTTTAGVTMMSSVVLVDGEEQAADQFDDDDEVRRALKQLAQALEAVLPILRAAESGVAINVDDDRANKEGGKESEHDEFVSSTPPAPSSSSAPPPPAAVVVSAAWLLQICQSYYQTSSSSEDLEPSVVAHAIVSAATQYRNDPVAQQSALFDALGASDAAMNLLSEVAPHLHQIAASIQIQDLETVQAVNIATAPVDTVVDLAEERRALLRQEAWDAASVAAAARAEADEILARSSSVAATATSSSSTGSHANGTTATHTLLRASDRQALKRADKAAQKAAKALQRAKDAGAILDESDLLNMDGAVGRGSGGLQHRSHEELAAIQAALLPEGSRQYYDDHGLPRGTIRETDSDGTQRAIIPPATTLEAGLQHPRLRVVDVIDPSLAPAFAGTSTLNPLQSAVYEAAHHSRENLLVCAPTGAGKTNVALLAATAHFRDVGLVPTSSSNPDDRGPIDAGTKVVYIAPMKALAQEVVDKFTDKLRPLGLVVRELTGDVQLSRAEAAAANVLVTVRSEHVGWRVFWKCFDAAWTAVRSCHSFGRQVVLGDSTHPRTTYSTNSSPPVCAHSHRLLRSGTSSRASRAPTRPPWGRSAVSSSSMRSTYWPTSGGLSSSRWWPGCTALSKFGNARSASSRYRPRCPTTMMWRSFYKSRTAGSSSLGRNTGRSPWSSASSA